MASTDSRWPDAGIIGWPVRRGWRLRIEYVNSLRSSSPELIVDPYGLLAKACIRYLVADCERVPHMYRLKRISTWSELGRPRHTRASQNLATVVAELLEHWEHAHAIEVVATIHPSQVERAQRIFGQQLIRGDHDGSGAGHPVTISFHSLEDVRAPLPFGIAITVHSLREAKE